MRNYIERIGFEVECGLDDKDDVCSAFDGLVEDCNVGSDGSVNVYDYEYTGAEIRLLCKYEKVRDVINIIGDLIEDATIGQDSTCGNHVHFGFSDRELAFKQFTHVSIRRKFIKLYEECWEGDDKYMERLRNEYCRATVDNLRRYYRHLNDMSRYRAINLKSFFRHGTIEFRVLPAFSSKRECIEAYLWLINTVKMLANDNVRRARHIHIQDSVDVYKKRVIEVKV